MIQNLCEIVVWHIFVNFVILISDSKEKITLVNMKGVFSNGKFIFKECLQSIS